MALENPAQDLIAALTTAPQTFLQPTSALYATSLLPAKRLLDPLAEEISHTQYERQQALRKKRKRGEYEQGSEPPILQLRHVHTEGFGASQVWEQAKKILEATHEELDRDVEQLVRLKDHTKESQANGVSRRSEADAEENEPESDDQDNSSSTGEVELDETDFTADSDEDGNEYGMEEYGDEALDREEFQPSNEEGSESSRDDAQEPFVADPNGLNDGFFSIDQFNKQSQFLEQRDALGEDDGVASDEEDVDWSVNPLGNGAYLQSVGRDTGRLRSQDKGRSEEDDENTEDDGPTFGDADLDALLNDSESDAEDALDVGGAMPGLSNTNEIRYADFFEPPPKKPSKSKRGRLAKTQPPPTASDGDDIETSIQRAISDVKRDIFDDEEDGDENESESSSSGQGIRSANLSTHERQRAKIAKEIQRLEAANVARKDWTLSGEARAAERPVNSLIEEDLEFERAGKPVPVITNEVSEEIEDLIKRRIIARDFDEVLRRRPDAISAQKEIRRGKVDVDDTKPQQGLADIYEAEHLRSTDPNYRDPRSEKLKREHAEINRLWKDISSKLDTLSNLHYKPKVPEANVNVVTDTPTIAMEDARPAVAGNSGDFSRLAPQEVYVPGGRGQGQHAEEIMRKGGAAVAREEMTRGEKLRRRRREKERLKKRKVNLEEKTSKKGGKAGEKQDILAELRRGGVKVIGNKGDVRDVDGKNVKKGKVGFAASDGGIRGSALKL